jgi:Tol biopolymer transport system component
MSLNLRPMMMYPVLVVTVSCLLSAAGSGRQAPAVPKATLFLPGIVSTGLNERDIAYDAAHKEIHFTVMNGPTGTICVTRNRNGSWRKPEVAPFSGRWSDLEPCLSPDGSRLYFVSNRPLDGKGEPKDYDVWVMTRDRLRWNSPVNVGAPVNSTRDEFYPSITHDGTIYFCGKFDSENEDLWRCRLQNGTYQPRENLGPNVNTPGEEFNAFVAPDESYVIFTSTGWGEGSGGGDLWISFRDAAGGWQKPVNLGDAVNSPAFEYCPSVSLDGTLLFFTSLRPIPAARPTTYAALQRANSSPGNGRGDIYVIDATLIGNLRRHAQNGN